METNDLDIYKPPILFLVYVVFAPILALIIARRRQWQRWVFAVMCFMTISGFLKPAEWGLTVAFDPEYRGHARGFHFFFNEALAIALILGNILDPKTRTRFFPPGLWLYLLLCFVCMLSYVNAPVKIYYWMAVVKALKMPLFLIAAYNFLREEEDMHFFLKIMSYTVIWQMIVVLKMKYVDGLYQVWGTFEHQNPLCMYTSMIGMVLLAVAAGAKHRYSNLYLVAFIACGVVVQSTLSRAGVVIFAAGTVGVMAITMLARLTKRRLIATGVLAAIAIVGLSFTMDTIVKRFTERYNVNSNWDRKLLNQASKQMLDDHWLGVGWNNYGVVINHPYHYGNVIEDFYWKTWGEKFDKKDKKSISESHYWLLLAENGYLGLIAYLVFILTYLWWSLRAAWTFRHRFLGNVSLGIAMGFSVNYVQGTLERVLTQPRNMMLWLILLGFTAKLEVWRRKKCRERVAARAPVAEPITEPVLLPESVSNSGA